MVARRLSKDFLVTCVLRFEILANAVFMDETVLLQIQESKVHSQRNMLEKQQGPCFSHCSAFLDLYAALPYGLAYVHIPKNAGHTIEQGFGIVSLEEAVQSSWYKCSAKMYEDCNYDQLGLSLFSSLRNPFDRAVSAYYHKQERMQILNLPTQTWPEYVEWLKTFDIRAYGLDGPKSYTPQFDCIVGNSGGAVVHHFVRLETLDDDWLRLQSIHPGLPDLPAARNEAADERPEWCTFYQDAAISSVIASLYSIDFSFANYTSSLTDYCT